MKYKLPLDKTLGAIDKRDMNYYSNLSDDDKKAFEPWLMMRYVSSEDSGYGEHFLLMVNGIVNSDFTLLSKHPELQWKLLALCGIGKKLFHSWIGVPKKNKINKTQKFLLEAYPNANSDELMMLEKMNTKKDLKLLAKDMGYDNTQIKQLLG